MVSYQITVVKVFEPKEVIGEEFIRESGEPIPKCGFVKEGQVFKVDEMISQPKGFCGHAWSTIFHSLWLLRNGNGYKDWTGENVIYSTCPDGIRPVCFKLEKLDT